MFKKFLKFIFPVFILLAFMSIDAKAVEEYPLWVGDQQVTSENLSGAAGDGSWSFSGNSSGGTLTLNNATITDKHNMNFEDYPDWNRMHHPANISCDTKNFNLTIQLIGDNKIRGADYGIYASENTYTIKGPGSITRPAPNSDQLNATIGSLRGGVNVENVDIIFTRGGYNVAIETTGVLKISNCSITNGTIRGNHSDVTISNSTLNMTSITCRHLTISNSNVTTSNRVTSILFDSGQGSITISNSTVNTGLLEGRYGRYGETPVSISNSTVNASNGINIERGNLTISGNSYVTAENEERAINIDDGIITLTDHLAIVEPEGGRFSDDLTTVLNGDGSNATRAVITVKKYPVRFLDEDGTVLQSSEIAYGATPEYTGRTPTKPADDQYTYTFAGWDPEIVPVAGETTYTAIYEAEARTHHDESEGDNDDVTPISDDEEEKTAQETDIDAPKTGDETNIHLWLIVMLASSMGLVLILIFRKKYGFSFKNYR